jgi:hypothetical protein
MTHLPGRQAHIGAEGGQEGVRAGRHHGVKIGRGGQCRGVVGLLGAVAPAIKDAQDDRFWMGHEKPLGIMRTGLKEIDAFGEDIFEQKKP